MTDSTLTAEQFAQEGLSGVGAPLVEMPFGGPRPSW